MSKMHLNMRREHSNPFSAGYSSERMFQETKTRVLRQEEERSVSERTHSENESERLRKKGGYTRKVKVV